MKKNLTALAILLIVALIPIPFHTTVWPFDADGSDFVSKYSAEPEQCYAIEERWAGLFVGIEVNRNEGRGEVDCAEWFKVWGLDNRCRIESEGLYKFNMDDRLPIWGIPAGENAITVGFGLIPLKEWSVDSLSIPIFAFRLASSGFGIYPFGGTYYPNLIRFGSCDFDREVLYQ